RSAQPPVSQAKSPPTASPARRRPLQRHRAGGGLNGSAASPLGHWSSVIGHAPGAARLTCEGCGIARGGEDPLDALDAADRAGWRLVELGPTTSQLCPACVQNRVNGGG